MKRQVISWDEYFMGVAKLSGMRSKDPNTSVGAVIVDEKKRIIGVGYNGLPRGCEDTEFPWENRDLVSSSLEETKYPYVVHAEANAILNSVRSLDQSTIYVSLFPCHECVKLIIQSGISRIIFEDDKYAGTPSDVAAKRMLDAANVSYQKMPVVDVKLIKK